MLRNDKWMSGHKLSTYRFLKQDFQTEWYTKTPLSKSHCHAAAKFRCGSTPKRLETWGYEGLSIEGRMHPFCIGMVGDETHMVT